MATKLTNTSRRSDFYMVNPDDLVVKESNRGRSKPLPYEKIVKMALSIFEFGQLQPSQVRKIGGEVHVNMGFTRYEAVKLIRAGFEVDGVKIHDPEWMLKVIPMTANDETAFINNIVENCHRNPTSPIDDALNIARARMSKNRTDQELATLFHISVQQVGRLEKLLALSQDHQDMVHEGTLPITAALDLLDIADEGERANALAAAIVDTGTVKGVKVRQEVRRILNDRNAKAQANGGTAKPKSKARSFKEILEFFKAESLTDDQSGAYAKKMVGFMKGEMTDAEFKAAYDEAFNPIVRQLA